MATNNIIPVKDFEIKSDQVFFPDNNFWMFLYCPIAGYEQKKQESASKFFAYLLSRKNMIAINSLIISEFTNASLRLDYSFWKEENQKSGNVYKKEYFQTDRAKNMRLLISDSVKKILRVATRFPDSFNNSNMDSILSVYRDHVDYNDSVIYHDCKRHNWILVTNDRDSDFFTDIVIAKI
ncbi:hypothetical protein [Edaphocola flava]|uniref:hypothetical protein n=1 Tax=Edaphocola flava TaxID=2499629 RepID=UPI00100B9C24|nr:hypothetical protein [Edaphocola flava]